MSYDRFRNECNDRSDNDQQHIQNSDIKSSLSYLHPTNRLRPSTQLFDTTAEYISSAACGSMTSQQYSGHSYIDNECTESVTHFTASPRYAWTHIDDLDTFFSRVYTYYWRGGLGCMVISEVLDLFQFCYVVIFSVFLVQCVDYNVLFARSPPTQVNHNKTTLSDIVLPLDQCLSVMPHWLVIILFVSLLFLALRLVRFVCIIPAAFQMRRFFTNALHISDSQLSYCTWHLVLQRLRDVQRTHRLSIHKPDLSELDVYQRILRFQNYMIAMASTGLFPIHFRLPCLGNISYLSSGLTYNIQLLFFHGPDAPFVTNFRLDNAYKQENQRAQLADRMSRRILCLALVNILLAPFILLWHLLHLFYTQTALLRTEPGQQLSARTWSRFTRLQVRHYNELDHQLHARLSVCQRIATSYMRCQQVAPLVLIVCRHIMFVTGSVLAVIVVLAVYDEDVLSVEHMLTLATLLGGCLALTRSIDTDAGGVDANGTCRSVEERRRRATLLMTRICACLHYAASHWRDSAYLPSTVAEFCALFPLRIYDLFEEILSPIVTPLLLIFYFRPCARKFVDFFGQYSINVSGVGDVCMLAQFSKFQELSISRIMEIDQPLIFGKCELSELNFSVNNPCWKIHGDDHLDEKRDNTGARAAHSGELISDKGEQVGIHDAETDFVSELHRSAIQDARDCDRSEWINEENPLCISLHALGVLTNIHISNTPSPCSQPVYNQDTVRLCDVVPAHVSANVLGQQVHLSNELTEMALSVTYLYELNKKRTREQQRSASIDVQNTQLSHHTETCSSSTPLLGPYNRNPTYTV